VIAVDAGSNQVSVLRIRPGGSLRLVSHGVVSSGGLLPDSVAVSGDLVYLANSGAGGSNYTGFRLRPNGRLDPIPAQGLGPFGSEFRSADPGQLFVSNAHNTATDSDTVSAFTDSADGTLSPVAGSPFADGQMAPCWVEITHDGQFLFTVNTASGTISRFSIAPDCVLTLLGSTPAGQVGGVGAVDARLSPDGGFLYVDESRIGKVGAFTVRGGNLTELSSSPTALPAGATPAGIVVN
jgi:6-phosphogluconolactonase